jgi:signal transduction histidine kinase
MRREVLPSIKFPLRDPDMRTVAIGGISLDVTDRRRAEQELSEIRRAERRRIARDLHDIVLQDLSGALQSLRLTHLQAKGSGMGLELEEELEALGRATSGLRSAIYDLRHEKERPFVKSVESLVELNRQANPHCKIRLALDGGFPEELPAEVSVELLRVLQEALTNARRHSRATSVEVSLRTEGEAVLVAEVMDDGRGFDRASVGAGVGALGDARAGRWFGRKGRDRQPTRQGHKGYAEGSLGGRYSSSSTSMTPSLMA